MRNSRLFIILGMIAVLLSAAFATQAQDSGEPWSIFIADTLRGEIIEARIDGSINVIDLNLPEQTFFGSRNVAIDENNTRAAFCATLIGNESEMAQNRLYIYDLTTGERIAERDYSGTSGCVVTLESMSDDGSNVLVSIFHSYPGDPNGSNNGVVWSLDVVDTATGEVIDSIDSNTDIVQAQNTQVPNTLATFPYVQNYNGEIAVVAMLPYGTEGLPQSPAFAWDRSAGTFTPAAEFWGRMNVSYLEATGEAAWVEYDENLPAADPGGPMISGNTVKVMNADGTVNTVYTNSEYVIFDTEFFADGEWLAIALLEPFNMDDPQPRQSVMWVAIARSGDNEVLFTQEGFSELTAVPGGYAALTGEMSEDGSTITMDLTANVGGSLFNIWEYAGENRGVVWGIIKSPAPAPQGELAPFPPSN